MLNKIMKNPNELIGQKFNKLTVIEFVEKDAQYRKYYKCKCDCGNETIVRLDKLRSGHTKSCGCLSGGKIKYEIVSGQRYGKLVIIKEISKTGHNRRVLCQCDCGNIVEVDFLLLVYNNTQSCGCLRKERVQKVGENNFLDLTGNKYGRLTVLERAENIGRYVAFKCKCECGNIVIVKAGQLQRGYTSSCGCIGNSKGEAKIEELLKKNNIQFEKEKIFNTCRFPDTNYPGRFDFYVNKQYLIEYDGNIHFKYGDTGWNTEDEFDKRFFHDKFKNNWCKENNIPLIRIPYTKYNDLCIEDLLLETSKYII